MENEFGKKKITSRGGEYSVDTIHTILPSAMQYAQLHLNIQTNKNMKSWFIYHGR